MEQALSSQVFSRDEIKTYEQYMQAARDERSEESEGFVSNYYFAACVADPVHN